ncbi:hypothetical protein PV08_00920 [Exophiala spinifera]|uniref:Uncharacterized protein n=1 Tax=Exophiala spinifera TaxID=91928 RepID=A0A0D2BP96_9EURO|nr:uncharacterized protein PV08_00920 [Exophiala spinifera]KIW20345.1 hypothetical protein PV08_00920 [Exophiala spinifera]
MDANLALMAMLALVTKCFAFATFFVVRFAVVVLLVVFGEVEPRLELVRLLDRLPNNPHRALGVPEPPEDADWMAVLPDALRQLWPQRKGPDTPMLDAETKAQRDLRRKKERALRKKQNRRANRAQGRHQKEGKPPKHPHRRWEDALGIQHPDQRALMNNFYYPLAADFEKRQEAKNKKLQKKQQEEEAAARAKAKEEGRRLAELIERRKLRGIWKWFDGLK